MPVDLTTATATLLDYLQSPTVTIVARLAKNSIDPEIEAPVLADLTQCDFPGYAPITDLGFDAVDANEGVAGHVLSADLEFAAGAIVTPQLCTAFYLTMQEEGHAAVLMHLEIFPEPFSFERAGQTFKRRVRIMTGGE
jgi:hypothetical protein